MPKQLAAGVSIRLSSPASFVNTAKGLSVTLRSGERVVADGVVVAVPLSILQRRSLQIEGMPTRVRSALDGLRMGSLEKVILQYADRWWPRSQAYGIVGSPGRRWAEWYDLTDLVGEPTLVGFSAATAAAGRSRSDASCIAEAADLFATAFG